MANVVVPAVASSTRTVPGAPTVSAADVGTGRAYDNGAATVTFTDPAFDGKLPITSYNASTVTGTPSGTNNGATSPRTITGLNTTSGGDYTFKGTVSNSIGASADSSTTATVTITSVPETPSAPTATAISTTSVEISWSTTPNNGGKTITGYNIVISPLISTSYSTSDTTSPITVTATYALNQAYTFQRRAINANGFGVYSSSSNSVTPNPRKLCTSLQISIACCTSTSSCGPLGAGSNCTTLSGTFDPNFC